MHSCAIRTDPGVHSSCPTHLARASTPHVVVVGGGFSAATFLVQLVRSNTPDIRITLIEPRNELGRGLAYSATDPDHRLNGPIEGALLDPDRPDELQRWCERNNIVSTDPASVTRGGKVFLRRRDFGLFVTETIAQLIGSPGFAGKINHMVDRAVSVSRAGEGYLVTTEKHGDVHADLLIVATGNPQPSLGKLGHERAEKQRTIGNPLQPGCLDIIPHDARVLVVGAGLTALDVLSTFVRRRHSGSIDVVSRRGMRPRYHSTEIVEGTRNVDYTSDYVRLDTNAWTPGFLNESLKSVLAWSRSLRAEIRKCEEIGISWHRPFDQVRDVVWKLWPQLPPKEQRRFLRRLGMFYDVHRFRCPPMNAEMVEQAESAGRIHFRTAAIGRIEPGEDGSSIDVHLVDQISKKEQRETYDYVVNCTGLDHAAAWRSNPFLASLIEQSLLVRHSTGLGFQVGPGCEALDKQGREEVKLRVIGPPTAGAFGDPLGIPFIAAQVRRMMPNVLGHLEHVAREKLK